MGANVKAGWMDIVFLPQAIGWI